MLRFFYLNNVRGFSDTLVPLSDVMFLVGENSTGKSSFLSLLNIVQNFAFWHHPDFDSDEHQLGTFHDLVSIPCTKDSTFDLGIAYSLNIQNQSQAIVLIGTFANGSGIPTLTRFSFSNSRGFATARATESGYSVRVHNEIQPLPGDKLSPEHVRQCIQLHNITGNTGFRKIDFPAEAPRAYALTTFIPATIEAEASSEPESPFSKKNRLFPQFLYTLSQPVWIAPIRTKPQRTYTGATRKYSHEGEHTPHAIKTYLQGSNGARFREYLTKMGKNGGLFDDVLIHEFGAEGNAPFELLVSLEDLRLPLCNVGYGVSQALPIIVEWITRPELTAFHVQQPEVHLHPRAQAAMGDLLFAMMATENKKFIIETHSDYLIDRFRLALRRTKDRGQNSAATLYFYRRDGKNCISCINIAADGSYDAEQPDEFRDFFIREELSLLGI